MNDLDDLWLSPSLPQSRFDPASLDGQPCLARRYLTQAIQPDTPLATAVRLEMHGTLKLNGRWHPFRAKEVIHWQRGMIWQATAWMNKLPVWGADRIVDGQGQMNWKLLGLLPVMQADGPDITRSALGRMLGEAMWLPSALCRPEVAWIAQADDRVQARFTHLGEPAHLTLTLGGDGSLKQVVFPRWGDPDGGGFGYQDFGAIAVASQTFGGYTIPSQLRVGWFLGSDRFEPEGEFFRCTLDQVAYR